MNEIIMSTIIEMVGLGIIVSICGAVSFALCAAIYNKVCND